MRLVLSLGAGFLGKARIRQAVLCKQIHIDKHSGGATIWLMDRDDITDAFARWKVAQDAFLATEQRFFATVGKGAHQFPVKIVLEADPLFVEVQTKRIRAEGLLLVAMKLLHERHGESKPRPRG